MQNLLDRRDIKAGITKLLFPPEIEKEFLQHYYMNIRGHLRVASVVGVLLFLVFGVHDALVYPEIRNRLWMVRYVFATPFMLVFIAYLFLGRSDRLMHLLAGGVVFIAGLAISIIVFLAHDPRQLYYTGLILVILFAYAISGMRLISALTASLLVTFSFAAMALYLQKLPFPVIWNDIWGLLSTNIIGVLAGYLSERFRRKEFIYLKQISLDMEALQIVNSELQHLSYHDPLTGVCNRRYFDKHLLNEWNRAVRYRYSLSLLMIDIDDFKAYNDHYGHLMGDEILKQVASAISRLVNRPGDIVARYGGEEFVVLMVGADSAGADLMAEEILSRVEALSIRHARSSRGLLTVSIGVSTILPSGDTSHIELIKSADTALYSAKRRGKNCYCRG